jgi:hypothetical protein
MTTDWLTDVASVLDGLEEILEALSDEGRLLAAARDVTRLVAWLRTQPRTRVLVLAALGAGLLVGAVLLRTQANASETGQPRAWSHFPVAEPSAPDPGEDWR